MESLTLDLVCVALAMVAGIGKAVKDKIDHHFYKSIFSNSDIFKFEYWNPRVSHFNKWLEGDYTKGEKFPFSSTVLVFVTDAWHLFQFIFVNSLIVAFSILGWHCGGKPVILFIYKLVLLMVIYKSTFELYYKHYLSK